MFLTKCSLGSSEGKNSLFPQELDFKKLVASQQIRKDQQNLGEESMTYCPVVWMLHSLLISNNINHFQERRLGIIYSDKASWFKELKE